MNLTLSSAFLNLAIDPASGSYELTSADNPALAFKNARISLRYHQNTIHSFLPGTPWKVLAVSDPYIDNTCHGPSRRIDLTCAADTEKVHIHLSFALLQQHPLALLRMGLENRTDSSLDLETLKLADIPAGGVLLGQNQNTDPAFYTNGWQSWSPSAAYLKGQKQQRSRLGFLSEPMIMNAGTPLTRQPNHFSSDMFGALLDRTSRHGLLAGFLSQKQHFGSLETRLLPAPLLKLWANGDLARLDPGKTVHTDWAAFSFFNLDDSDPFTLYLQAVQRENQARIPNQVPLGWCSWYQYFTKITPDDLSANLTTLLAERENLPLSLFQIDDGFQAAVGDWLAFNPKFPDGVAPLAAEIKSHGLTPGIWLAPFIVQSGAKIQKDHPDWLLRTRSGRKVSAGFAWNSLATALDLSNPQVRDYVHTVIHTAVQKWGFPYLKLDFLYAGALPGQYQDRTLTRAQVLRRAFEVIREAAGEETTLLACGCPLGSALGLFDTMRISADVAPNWLPAFGRLTAPFADEPNMPSARNAIQNILTRASLDKTWWVNDPDCLLVRPDSNLTLPEVQSLTSVIGLTGGALLLSDDLTRLPLERLALAQLLIPLIAARCQVIDLFDRSMPARLRLDLDGPAGSWIVLGAFNWQDQPADIPINTKDWHLDENTTYIGRELWTGQLVQFTGSQVLSSVPPHAARVLALRTFDPAQPCYLGSSLHLSQGLELHGWKVLDDRLTFDLSLPRCAHGIIFLYLPSQPAAASLDGQCLEIETISSGIYALEVSFETSAQLVITWK